MKIFNSIIGVLSILSGVYCIFYPGLTFINSGWIVAVLLGVWGIFSIVDYVANRKNAQKNKREAAMGAVGLVVGILAAVISILALFTPAVRAMLDITILGVFAGWLIIDGISSIISAVKAKGMGGKLWIVSLICGIVVALAGIYGIFHLLFIAQTIGLLIGILLMVYGIGLILSVFQKTGE